MTEETKMSDLISRQMAINAPEKFTKDCNPEHFVGNQKFIEFMDSDEIRSFGKWQFANGFNMGLAAAEVEIKKLPSAEPEWIPVSERLPKVGETVIAQCRANIISVLKLDADGDWYQDAEHCYMSGFVIAWMPLPEPYKASKTETGGSK